MKWHLFQYFPIHLWNVCGLIFLATSVQTTKYFISFKSPKTRYICTCILWHKLSNTWDYLKEYHMTNRLWLNCFNVIKNVSVKTKLILNKFSRLLQRGKFIIFKRNVWMLRQQWEHYHFKQNDFFIKEILELYNTYVEKVLIENDLPEGFRPMCKLCLPLVVNPLHWNDEQNVITFTIHF